MTVIVSSHIISISSRHRKTSLRTAVLYWFKLVRGPKGSVEFTPYLIDNDSGVGTQVVARDLNGDGLPDIVVGNKKGTFVHLHEKKTVTREEWEKAQPKRFVPFSSSGERP